MKLPKSIKHNPFYRGILFGLGIISILFTGALVAVAVTGTMNTFSSGQVLDATAMNTNFNSLKTAIEGIPSQKAMRLIYENDITAPTTSVNITGLDGDSDVQYKIIYRIISNGGTTSNQLYITINNDTNTSNYGWAGYSGYLGSSTVAYASSATALGLILSGASGGANNGSVHTGEGTLFAKSGNFRTMIGNFSRWLSSPNAYVSNLYTIYSVTGTNITSIQFNANESNTIGAGSRIEVWARR
ncbi:MAG: hypothetical protein SFU98_04565 [Leptospiraceae bacterium]|nr:hypothetical protein [Leptospiraceae bacterium]